MSNVINLDERRKSFTVIEYINALEDDSITDDHRKMMLTQLYNNGFTNDDIVNAIENI